MKHRCSSSLWMVGSPSQQSRMRSAICPRSSPCSRTSLGETGPRQALMSKGRRRHPARKASSTIPAVAYFPVRVRGTCSVMMSLSAWMVSSETKPSAPSRAARGGSQSKGRKPKAPTRCASRPPTFPTPTMPIVFPRRETPRTSDQRTSEERTYCTTPPALHPGAFSQPMPAVRQ